MGEEDPEGGDGEATADTGNQSPDGDGRAGRREHSRRSQSEADPDADTSADESAPGERERRLAERERRLSERAATLDERERALDRRETEVEASRETLQEYLDQGGADAFTDRPRVTAAAMLCVVGVVAGVLAVVVAVSGPAQTVPPASWPLPSISGSDRVAVAGLVGVATVELLGGITTYYAQYWAVSVVAAVVAVVVLPPVGIAATVMLTVGESDFD